MKNVLTIGGSDSIGGAGIQADLKTFAASRVYGTSVITSVTAQNTTGVQGVIDLPSRFVGLQIDSVISDVRIEAVKIGMLLTDEIVNVVADKVKKHKLKNVVLDPVMFSHSDTPLLNPSAKNILAKKMFPLSILVTPNIPEASIFAGITIKNHSHVKKAARKIHKLGAKNILIKGGHLKGAAVDTFYDGKSFRLFESPCIPGGNVHGTGCTLASAIAAELAKGASLINAIQKAKDFITSSIQHSINPGSGSNIIDHFYNSKRESEKQRMLSELERTMDILLKGEIGCLIPEVQSNFGYGLDNAKSKDDILAFPDRIVKKGNGIAIISVPKFGGSSHVASIVLTAMNHDPAKKAVMNIKYFPEITKVCKKLKLSYASFSRSREPRAVKRKEGSSLEWGTDQAIKKFGSVPDIIYDTGGMEKEPMIRVLASSPVSVANIILNIKTEYLKRQKIKKK